MRVKHWVTWQRKPLSSRPGFPRSSRAAAGLDVPGCREEALELQQKLPSCSPCSALPKNLPAALQSPPWALWGTAKWVKSLSQRMNSLGVPAGNKTTLSVWNSNSSEGKEAFKSTKYWGFFCFGSQEWSELIPFLFTSGFSPTLQSSRRIMCSRTGTHRGEKTLGVLELQRKSFPFQTELPKITTGCSAPQETAGEEGGLVDTIIKELKCRSERSCTNNT